MAIESIGQTATSTTSQSSLGQEDFLKILTTQLNYQDPLKPMDNQQFMAQMAQFASLEQTRAMNDNIETLLTIQSATQSVGLLGRTVEVSTDSDTAVGEVTSLRFSNGQPLLTVKTAAGQTLTDLSVSKIVIVR
ncbi:MAG TPA: flagellar hook capping FlgD N-terminal domain-containing protein [Burkholderiaceae bacterium]|nr:flagellar hook capping FlgD N-terminal domain-containing protein [Burkholderiaceae bacterium]